MQNMPAKGTQFRILFLLLLADDNYAAGCGLIGASSGNGSFGDTTLKDALECWPTIGVCIKYIVVLMHHRLA